jgi:hypothetical protein
MLALSKISQACGQPPSWNGRVVALCNHLTSMPGSAIIAANDETRPASGYLVVPPAATSALQLPGTLLETLPNFS